MPRRGAKFIERRLDIQIESDAVAAGYQDFAGRDVDKAAVARSR